MKKLRSVFLFLILAGAVAPAFTGCAATQTRESTGEYVDDTTITTKVKTDLIRDPVVKARQIDVNTFRGVVQLSGFVDSNGAKTRAAQIASNVSGVREVRNNLVVK